MSNNAGSGNAGPGNSSNPRPGHSPFPQSSALIRRDTDTTPGTENRNNAYSSQYNNNFNRAESRYTTARNESIFGYYDYDRSDGPTQDGPSQSTPRNNQQKPADRTSSKYSQDEDEDEDVEEIPRDYNDQSQAPRNESTRGRYSPRPRSNASRRQSERPSSETRANFETRSNDDGTETGSNGHARVKVNIDFMNGGSSWTGTVPGDRGVSINLGGGDGGTWTPLPGFARDNQRFGGGFPLGGTRLFNGSGFPVNLPFGL